MEEKGKLYVGFDGTGLFKIGITQDYKKRFKQFRTSNPTFHFALIFNVDNPTLAEAYVHTTLSHRHYRGEWYDLEPEDLKWIYDKYTVEGRHGIKDFQKLCEAVGDGLAMFRGLDEHLKGFYFVDGGEE